MNMSVEDRMAFRRTAPSLAQIALLGSAFFEIDQPRICSASRKKNVALARQALMVMARELTPVSLVEIGKFFGRKDHTTVIHGIRAVKARAAKSVFVSRDLETLERNILAVVRKPDGSKRSPEEWRASIAFLSGLTAFCRSLGETEQMTALLFSWDRERKRVAAEQAAQRRRDAVRRGLSRRPQEIHRHSNASDARSVSPVAELYPSLTGGSPPASGAFSAEVAA